MSALILAAVVVGGCGGQVSAEPPQLVAQAPVSRRELAQNGTFVRFPEPGRVTIIDFWALSCGPCLRTMPEIDGLWRQKRDAGLVVIGIGADDNPGLVQEFLSERKIRYPNIMDTQGQIRGAYRVSTLPHVVVIDRRGRIRLVRRGSDPRDINTIRNVVDALLEETL